MGISRLRIYFVIVELTSIPLAVLMLLFIYSGYGLISTTMENYGFSYNVSVRIHTSRTLRLMLIALTYLHGVSGFNIMVYRYVKDRRARLILEAASIIIAFLTLIPVIHAETTLQLIKRRGRISG